MLLAFLFEKDKGVRSMKTTRVKAYLGIMVLLLGLIIQPRVVIAAEQGAGAYFVTGKTTFADPNKPNFTDGESISVLQIKKSCYVAVEIDKKLYASVLNDGWIVASGSFADSKDAEKVKKDEALSEFLPIINPDTGLPSTLDVRIEYPDNTVHYVSKIHIYDANGDYVGGFTPEEFVKQTLTTDSSIEDSEDQYDGKGVFKFKEVTVNKEEGYADATVYWDLRGCQNFVGEEPESVESFSQQMRKDGNNLEYRPSESVDDQLRETFKGSNFYIEGEGTFHVTMSGELEITMNTNRHTYIIKKTIDLSKESKETTEKDEKEDKLKVWFEGVPTEDVIQGTYISITMLTNVKAVKTFDLQADNKLSTKSSFKVNKNGSYEYRAETPSGQVVTGKLKITCFKPYKDKVNTDDYFTDPNMPTQGTLPQTGSIPWWGLSLMGAGAVGLGVGIVKRNVLIAFIRKVVGR